MENMNKELIVQKSLDLRKSIFPFLNRGLFDLKKIYVVNLKTGCPKKMPYVGESFLNQKFTVQLINKVVKKLPFG